MNLRARESMPAMLLSSPSLRTTRSGRLLLALRVNPDGSCDKLTMFHPCMALQLYAMRFSAIALAFKI